MENELLISGVGISESVVNTIVSSAVSRVPGVASVGDDALSSGLTAGLMAIFTPQPSVAVKPVTCTVSDEGMSVDVHIVAFFGYQFSKLAEDVRNAVSAAICAQLGIDVVEVNIFIDDLVFPKE